VHLNRLASSKRKAEGESPDRVPKKSKRTEDKQRVQTSTAKKGKSKGKGAKSLKHPKKGKKSGVEGDGIGADEWAGLIEEEESNLDAHRQLLFEGSDADEANGFEGNLDEWLETGDGDDFTKVTTGNSLLELN